VKEAGKDRRSRIGILTVVLMGLFVLVLVRLAAIVLVDGPRLVSVGRSEHSAQMDLAAIRGPIVDRDDKPLALSAETRSIYARPRTLLANGSLADQVQLAGKLGLTTSELRSHLMHGAPFVWLQRHLSPARARAVEQLGLDGVGIVSEYKRFYPESNLAAAVVGLAGTDGQGLSGVELQYDRLIRGEPAQLHFYHDALGRPILDSPLELTNSKPGARLELTIDSTLQAEAENYLADQILQSGASRAAAVILDPFTGEVLGLANVTGNRLESDKRLHDTAVQDVFEPGSTMKGLLGAIALEDGVLDSGRQIYCEHGEWRLDHTTIHDDASYGWLNLGGIIEVSSNIGAAKIALAVGRLRFYQGMAAFGLGHKTGIDLPGEGKGLLPPASSWRQVDLANHGFGQGVAVTPIQMAIAYAAIANGGVVMRPYVLKAAYDADGQPLVIHGPEALRRALRPAVAHSMNSLLRGVVNGRDGTAHLAQVADVTVAGKTGTAQMVNPATGTYYRNRLVASFVGFLPADDPKLVILVVLYDVPRGRFGGLVAAPVFSRIASDAAQRLSMSSTRPPIQAASMFPALPLGGDDPAAAAEPDVTVPSDASAVGQPADPTDSASAGSTPDVSGLSQNEGEAASKNGHVPDFRGLSLRSALAVARLHKLAVEVTGEGYVVQQQPAAGAPTSNAVSSDSDDQVGGVVKIVLAGPANAFGASSYNYFHGVDSMGEPRLRFAARHHGRTFRRASTTGSDAESNAKRVVAHWRRGAVITSRRAPR
jgi:cell division protein FtsI (penicillin-binding protein 3)